VLAGLGVAASDAGFAVSVTVGGFSGVIFISHIWGTNPFLQIDDTGEVFEGGLHIAGKYSESGVWTNMSNLEPTVLLADRTALFLDIGFMLGGPTSSLIALVVGVGMSGLTHWNSARMMRCIYGAQQVNACPAPCLCSNVKQVTPGTIRCRFSARLISSNAAR